MNSYLTCADCSSPDPSWASINRGVLLCNECCSVHRVMGTHISHVRAITSTNWPPVLKEMVYSLVNKGANTVWEHQLLDTHSKVKIKKPNPRDKIHPTKHDFIVSKYKHLSFLPRISNKDNFNSISDMSKQLHASVRTSNLETCLRLLSLGADPNYMHTDRGNTPLHVAAQAGQAMQVELLMVNGADPSRLDRLGHTSEECARIAGHHQLADRLVECQYELTDKLSNFVSGRKPVHSIGEHFLVPQVGRSNSLGMADARNRLQEISNDLFEDLAADVYDEVDRRETDSLWLTTQQLQSSIAFLPVNPTLSPLRNQGRQKLATLNAQDFAELVIDILLDTKRRQSQSVQTGERSGTVVPMTGDDTTVLYDSHDYDEVPMDESHSPPVTSPSGISRTTPTRTTPTLQDRPLPPINPEPAPPDGNSLYSQVDQDDIIPEYAELKDPPPRQSVLQTGVSAEGVRSGSVSRAKFDLVKDKLKSYQTENDQLRTVNHQLQMKLDDVQRQLNKVVEENVRLRSLTASSAQQRSPTTPTSPLPVIMEPATLAEEEEEEEGMEIMELYAQVDKTKKSSRSSTGSYSGSRSSIGDHRALTPSSPHQATPLEDTNAILAKKMILRDDVTTPPLRQDTPLSDSPFEDPLEPPPAPSLDTVHHHIKGITQCIQELLRAAQSHQQASFGPSALQTANAVETLTKIFPQGSSQEVVTSLNEVNRATHKLQEECGKPSGHSDLAYRKKVIINLAYDVAKACRHLVTSVEQGKSSNP